MDGSGEREGVERFSRRPDLLSERWTVTYSIRDDILMHALDLGRDERGYILGTTETDGRRVRLEIKLCGKGLPESQEEDRDLAGSSAELSPLVLMRDRLQDAAEHHSEFDGLVFLGEIRSTSVNEIDLLELKEAYESGDFRPHEPCILGVLKKDESGKPQLEFLRIVRDQRKAFYSFKPVERAEKPTE